MQRLASFNVDVEALSITEFQFSEQFRRAVEAKVEADEALQATNDLRRIEIEAQQQKQGLLESSTPILLAQKE